MYYICKGIMLIYAKYKMYNCIKYNIKYVYRIRPN